MVIVGIASAFYFGSKNPKNIIRGRVVEENFLEDGSYIINDDLENRIKFNFDTKEYGLYFGPSKPAQYHGKSKQLDGLINIGDYIEVIVEENQGIEKKVWEILNIRKK